jgi:class 3 adenylate cyclase
MQFRQDAGRLKNIFDLLLSLMEATHQLAAIMFTDMEGYTALRQKNKQAAIEPYPA